MRMTSQGKELPAIQSYVYGHYGRYGRPTSRIPLP